MNVLLLADRGTKAAIKHPELDGLPRIGRGKFSVVFDKGETVVRLTADRIVYDLLSSNYARGPHFPKLVNDWGYVGEQHDGQHGLYMFETEKLVGLTGNIAARRQANWVQRMRSDGWDKFHNSNEESMLSLQHMHDDLEQSLAAGWSGLPQTMLDAFETMGCFAADHECPMLDLHNGNFMVRPACGTLIFNDPFADLGAFTARMQKLKGAA
jgi:hypothetical protein